MSRIKLCGLRRLEDIDFINEVRPDFAGIILADPKRFHRAISREQALAMRRRLRDDIPLVGVFVDNPFDHVTFFADAGIIDYIQLHGSETNDFIREVRYNTGKPVVKAFRVQEEADVQKALRCSADQILLDSGAGSGETFDWSVVNQIDRAFILAGGLNPDNLAAAIAQTHPWAVDISSGVETNGIKDLEKMRKAVEIARNHW